MFLHLSVILFMGGGPLYDITSCLVAWFNVPSGGLCAWSHVPGGGCLCLGGFVLRGIFVKGVCMKGDGDPPVLTSGGDH